jgi:hypothetical protein
MTLLTTVQAGSLGKKPTLLDSMCLTPRCVTTILIDTEGTKHRPSMNILRWRRQIRLKRSTRKQYIRGHIVGNTSKWINPLTIPTIIHRLMKLLISSEIKRSRLNLRNSLKVKIMDRNSMRTEGSILKKLLKIITVNEIHCKC